MAPHYNKHPYEGGSKPFPDMTAKELIEHLERKMLESDDQKYIDFCAHCLKNLRKEAKKPEVPDM